MSSDFSPIKSASYFIEPAHYTALFFGNLLKTYWYIFGFMVLAGLAQVLFAFIQNPFPFSLILPVIYTVLFFVIRWRIISKMQLAPGFQDERDVTIYEDRMVFTNGKGEESTVLFSDISSYKLLKSDYQFKYSNKRMLWLPKSGFSYEQQIDIESHFRSALNSIKK